MSHTGSVIQEDESPGMIRVITTGYVVSKQNELIFRMPKHHEEPNRRIKDAQERFVVYLNPRKKNFAYGDGVNFNLEPFDRWNNKISDAELENLKNSIPDKWFSDNEEPTIDDLKEARAAFKFKYISTDVEKVPNDFILNSFYKFISDLDPKSIEKVITVLDKLKDYELKYPLEMRLKGGKRTVNMVKVLEAIEFDEAYRDADPGPDSSYFVKDYKDVDDEIEKHGHHKKSTENEIPVRLGRFN